MARTRDAGLTRRARRFGRTSDLAALSGKAAAIDARYGESLRALLPRRLADLLPRLARAA